MGEHAYNIPWRTRFRHGFCDQAEVTRGERVFVQWNQFLPKSLPQEKNEKLKLAQKWKNFQANSKAHPSLIGFRPA
jgi:hypothetical protein